MMLNSSSSSFWFFLYLFLLHFFFCSNTRICYGADTLSSGQSITSNQTLVSIRGNFALGFFKPGTSPKFYIGIWYNTISPEHKTIVWVANRDTPITSDPSSSELKLLPNGNLVLLNPSKIPIWSTNLSSKAMNSSQVVLEDDGNLVLRDESNPTDVLWQSFDHPTDTWLPGGKLRYDNKIKQPTLLTSWKNSEDPAQGMFSLRLDPVQKQYKLLWNRSIEYWTSGPWDGQIFSLVPEMKRNLVYNLSYAENENESYFTYSVYNQSIITRFVMDLSGQLRVDSWLDVTKQWNLFWSKPSDPCKVYAHCGAFGMCNQLQLPFCQCFEGFKPHSLRDWNLGDYSGGCVRKSSLQCKDKVRFQPESNVMISENDRFTLRSEYECQGDCQKNCSCQAYYIYSGTCLIFNGDILDRRLADNIGEGRVLYVKFPVSEFPNFVDQKKNVKVIIIPTVLVGVTVFGVLSYICWRWTTRKRGIILFNNSNDIKESLDSSELGDNPDIPFFNLEKLAIATNYFDATNKLGQGGYGPVYKGNLSDGREVAVKRLSTSSGQGLKEFRNEVVVISKLQHRNLVMLLGCCIERGERMLIYEYMPNKSLDAFIFDPTKQEFLDWRTRFKIIMGICRGIIYLHRDSRLKVIHRDLKASNILLDQWMNPKISDFGMARIFGSDELQANTKRVVGTYGYMSPEYAMEGLFSEKSDVFSFGVLLLELVSGKRNTRFYHHEQSWSLIGYAWTLWNEGKIQELIDPVISRSSYHEEILRCIHVGLLCVQEFAKDRPSMPSVVSMLNSEISNLTTPKQPAFTGGRVISHSDSSQDKHKTFSKNILSITNIEGR